MNLNYMSDKGKIAAALLFVSLAPLLAGALAAPFAFNLLVYLARNFEWLEGWRQIEFESILTRSIMICAFLFLWPALRIASRTGFRLRKLYIRVGWISELGKGFMLGIFSMGLIPVMGLAVGGYVFKDELRITMLAGALFYMLVALLVGFLEETLFRGVVYDWAKRLVSLLPAVLIAGLLFSLAHFLNPMLPAGVVHGHWHSGFQTLWRAVQSFDFGSIHFFPYSLTLFLIGSALCIVMTARGDILMIAGIHAGWIWILKVSAQLLERTDHYGWLLGHDMIISKTYAAVIIATAFLLVVVLISMLPRRHRSR